MDDIYFSDKKKRPERDDGLTSRRFSPNEFTDTDYFDESFELNFKKKGSSQAFSGKEGFKVHLPSDEDIFSQPQINRTPTGKPVSFTGETGEDEIIKRKTPSFSTEKDFFIGEGISEGRPEIKKENVNKDEGISMASHNTRNANNRTPSGRPVQNRTPQGTRVNTPPAKPVRMSREGSPSHSRPPQKPPASKKKVIILSVIGVVAVFLFSLVGFGLSALNGLNYDDTIVDNAYVDESTLASSDDVTNILFVGSDARGDVEGQRSDTMMLFSIDKQNKKLKLTSFLRDSYVYIPSKKFSTKLNSAFSYGGTQLVMDTIEYNFGIRIDHYIMVDFTAFRQLVDLLGGITVKGVTQAEADYMTDVVKIKTKKGKNKMNGKKALWYCRIRYVDNDFRRTERQRKVIKSIVSKALKTNPFKLMNIVKQVLPNVSTDINKSELIGLATGAALRYIHYDIKQKQIPADGTWSDARISGQLVLKMDIEQNSQILKSFLYDKEKKK